MKKKKPQRILSLDWKISFFLNRYDFFNIIFSFYYKDYKAY